MRMINVELGVSEQHASYIGTWYASLFYYFKLRIRL